MKSSGLCAGEGANSPQIAESAQTYRRTEIAPHPERATTSPTPQYTFQNVDNNIVRSHPLRRWEKISPFPSYMVHAISTNMQYIIFVVPHGRVVSCPIPDSEVSGSIPAHHVPHYITIYPKNNEPHPPANLPTTHQEITPERGHGARGFLPPNPNIGAAKGGGGRGEVTPSGAKPGELDKNTPRQL